MSFWGFPIFGWPEQEEMDQRQNIRYTLACFQIHQWADIVYSCCRGLDPAGQSSHSLPPSTFWRCSSCLLSLLKHHLWMFPERQHFGPFHLTGSQYLVSKIIQIKIMYLPGIKHFHPPIIAVISSLWQSSNYYRRRNSWWGLLKRGYIYVDLRCIFSIIVLLD